MLTPDSAVAPWAMGLSVAGALWLFNLLRPWHESVDFERVAAEILGLPRTGLWPDDLLWGTLAVLAIVLPIAWQVWRRQLVTPTPAVPAVTVEA